MNKSLYNINEEQRLLVNQLIESEGELTPELEEALEMNQKNRNQKAVAYLEVISRQEATVKMIEEEIKRLQALKKTKTNIVTRLKDNLLNCVKAFGAFEVGTLKFGTRKSTVLIVDDEKIDKIPNEYKTKVTTIKVDKTAIKKALKDGAELEGCRLQENLNLKIN